MYSFAFQSMSTAARNNASAVIIMCLHAMINLKLENKILATFHDEKVLLCGVTIITKVILHEPKLFYHLKKSCFVLNMAIVMLRKCLNITIKH